MKESASSPIRPGQRHPAYACVPIDQGSMMDTSASRERSIDMTFPSAGRAGPRITPRVRSQNVSVGKEFLVATAFLRRHASVGMRSLPQPVDVFLRTPACYSTSTADNTVELVSYGVGLKRNSAPGVRERTYSSEWLMRLWIIPLFGLRNHTLK